MTERDVSFKERAAKFTAIPIAALGLVACSGSSESSEPTQKPERVAIDVSQDVSRVDVTQKYTQNGQRVTQYAPYERESLFSETLAYCDGVDLVEVTNANYTDAGPSALTRSVGHAACIDGVLRPEDFQPTSLTQAPTQN